MNNEDYCNNIKEKLARLVAEVELDSKANLHSINIHAESFFREFLNTLYDWNLTNANADNPNAKGIDLLYPADNIVVQVSSTATYDKIQSSIEKSKAYSGAHFYFVSISKKHPSFRKPFDTHGLVFNEETDILDTSHLFATVVNCGSIKTQKRLSNVVDQYFDHQEAEKISNEKKKGANKHKEFNFVLRFLVYGLVLLFIAAFLALIGMNIERNNLIMDMTKTLQIVAEKNNQNISTLERIPARNEIDPEKASVLYSTGLELYNAQHYKDAAIKLKEAIAEQESITGAGSTEVGIIYSLLGLSRLYDMHIIESNGEDAVTALNYAIQIFKKNGEKLHLARCYYYLGTAYFETGDSHLNRAIDQANNGIHALQEYYPDGMLEMDVTDNNAQSATTYFDYYDYESIYQECNYYMLLQDIYNLVGKVYSRNPEWYSLSFFKFNQAIDMNARLIAANDALVRFEWENQTGIENEEVKEYLGKKPHCNMLGNIEHIKVYYYDEETGEIDNGQFSEKAVDISSNTATMVSNRAMSELSLGLYELAVEDCMKALDIWKELPYSSWGSKSYTYNYLVIAKIGAALTAEDALAYLEEKEELKDYIETAIMLDIDFWGEKHYRTAYSYENKGLLYAYLEEPEIAIQSYEKAIAIYEANGDDNKAEFCWEQIEAIMGAD